jgi:hypothetical protein
MSTKKLDRRRFLKASGAGLTGLTLLPNLSFIAGAQTRGASSRRIYSLNHGWLFSEKVAAGRYQSRLQRRRVSASYDTAYEQATAVAWIR